MKLMDRVLMDQVSALAKSSPRGRKNWNFHANDVAPCHRLLNGMEPGSYIAPHRHLDPNKGEAILVVRGRLGFLLFDAQGNVMHTARLGPAEMAVGSDTDPGEFHSIVSLESGTVFLECKAGPYLPLTAEEKAPWAPAENSPGAPEYLARLEGLFAS
jgi:cupin fold WbuC family metalloprotein